MIVSPIKIQGKKTKILPEIIMSLPTEKDYVWIEPFLGSGEVLFNVNPKYALVCDNNKHIINFFKALQCGSINSKIVRDYLEHNGKILENTGKEYYYKIRENFNKTYNSLDFLFLNRSCFNGIMRFNSNGNFNVPFCNKNNRFEKALITKIVNQVAAIQQIILEHGYNWKFVCCDWKEVNSFNDFKNKPVFYYFDPPYIERHSTYYNSWTEKMNDELFCYITKLNHKFILSNWFQNKYRVNNHIAKYFDNNSEFQIKKIYHYYHVGAKASNRQAIIECLILNYKKEGGF